MVCVRWNRCVEPTVSSESESVVSWLNCWIAWNTVMLYGSTWSLMTNCSLWLLPWLMLTAACRRERERGGGGGERQSAVTGQGTD